MSYDSDDIFDVTQAEIINTWANARGFHGALTSYELSTIKRINIYTSNLFRDSSYRFIYSKVEAKTLNSVRKKWIKFLKTVHT